MWHSYKNEQNLCDAAEAMFLPKYSLDKSHRYSCLHPETDTCMKSYRIKLLQNLSLENRTLENVKLFLGLMEPLDKKGIFCWHSKFSEAYWILISSQKQKWVNRDITFHEEVVFKRSREFQIKDKPDSPTAEISGFDFQREESHDDPMLELAELAERSIEEPPIKRRFACIKEKLKKQRNCSPFQEPSEKEKGLQGLQVILLW